MADLLKVKPADGYPPERGCYLRGNDFSPVAVCVILKWRREETPKDIENLVRVAVESGAAIAGTLQTENIGLEKVICNIVANPNIRYLVLCGPESPGHLTGESVIKLIENGIDKEKKIIGSPSPTPYLYNVPEEFIDRFRKQLTLVNLLNQGDPELIKMAVVSCYQEEPTKFREYQLYDLGAYPESPLDGKITWRINEPYNEPKSEEERKAKEKARAMMEMIKKRLDARRKGASDQDEPE
ncbi:MAG: tetrahydromethanopterin S-methyltransferase subunit A [Planctomycetota bacterium]